LSEVPFITMILLQFRDWLRVTMLVAAVFTPAGQRINKIITRFWESVEMQMQRKSRKHITRFVNSIYM